MYNCKKCIAMNSKIKWGIIALGRIAEKFAFDLALVPDAELVAVASRDMKKSKEFALKHNATHAFDSYEEMLKTADIDIVYIASPHTYHYEHTMLCFKYNKHVLCEKPMGMNANEVKKMIEVAEQKKLYLMEAFWTRFSPSYTKCLDIIANDSIGEIKHIQADFGFKANTDPNGRWMNKKLGGGSLLDIGIYPVFLALNLLGKPDNIQAMAHLSESGIDLSTSMIFNYKEKQAFANLSSTFAANTAVEAVISGTKGRITFQRWWHTPTSLTVTTNEETENIIHDEKGFGYQYEAKQVCKDLLNNKLKPDLFTHTQSILLHETLDEIREIIGLKYT